MLLTIQTLMTRELYTLQETDTVQDAHALMNRQHVRHIPILDAGGELCGLLTQRDLLAVSLSTFAEVSHQERAELETGIPLSEVMIREVVVATENTDLLEAAQFLLDTKHGCLPVVGAAGKLCGILTEADFVKLAIQLLKAANRHETAL